MPPKTVAGKRVLVTGAGSGIGRATAVAAAAKGAQVFLTDVNAEALEAVAEPDPQCRRQRSLREGARHLRPRGGRRDGGRDPRRARQPRRGHEHRRDRHLGNGRDALARAVAPRDRRQPDGPHPRDRVVRAGDDRRRPRRAAGQRVVGRRSLRPSLARAVQRGPSSGFAASRRCCASTCAATGSASAWCARARSTRAW